MERGREKEEERVARKEEIKKLLPSDCKLDVSDSVSPECIWLGKLICSQIEKHSGQFPNVRFLGKLGLLNTLIPWTGYNVLARRGQTDIMDKFWFAFGGLIHGTVKLPYQENMLWYALVKKAMSQVAYD